MGILYLPCMATLASMMRELGWRLTLASGALLALAVIVSVAARGVLAVLGGAFFTGQR